MELHHGISTFVKVAQCGSFSKAAKVLRMPVSTASTQISLLEKRLGVTLIHRTTRKLYLTEAGQVYYQSCLNALNEISFAENRLSELKSELQGAFKISVPVHIGYYVIVPILHEFLKIHPKVHVELQLINQLINPVDEKIDLAVHAGELKDSSFKMQLLKNEKIGLWASPAYLLNEKSISHPLDLEQHTFIQYLDSPCQMDLKLTKNNKSYEIKPKSKIKVNDILAAKILAELNHGIAILPFYICEKEVLEGKLINILPEWDLFHFPLWFVYPQEKFKDTKVNSFINFAKRFLRQID